MTTLITFLIGQKWPYEDYHRFSPMTFTQLTEEMQRLYELGEALVCRYHHLERKTENQLEKMIENRLNVFDQQEGGPPTFEQYLYHETCKAYEKERDAVVELLRCRVENLTKITSIIVNQRENMQSN